MERLPPNDYIVQAPNDYIQAGKMRYREISPISAILISKIINGSPTNAKGFYVAKEKKKDTER